MEVALRAAVIFVILWLVIRATGKRQISQLSAFELILLITLGDLVAQGVLEEDTSLTGAAIAVSTFALLSVALAWFSWRFERSRPLLQGLPTVVVHHGELIAGVLDAERMPLDDLHEAAREKGIRTLADVDLAILEPDGKFSFFMAENGGTASKEPDDQDAANEDTGGQAAT